jgi:hypothetical protein
MVKQLIKNDRGVLAELQEKQGPGLAEPVLARLLGRRAQGDHQGQAPG